MKNFEKALFAVLQITALTAIVGCSKNKEEIEKEDIVIVFTNDTHTYVDGNMSMSKVASYVDSLKEGGKNVVFVDAGDHLQGTAYGSLDKGSAIVDIMNVARYDVVVPGNHEFDYGMNAFLANVKKANYPYISCNFKKNGQRVFADSEILDFDGTKIGFVGVTTPLTITTSTPKFFQNEEGQYIYTFDGQNKAEDLYASFQESVDAIKDKVDYVVGLGHLGIGMDAKVANVSSTDLINNTNGIVAFIDGHSHTTIDGEEISNKDNNKVALAQTGANNQEFGVMTIKTDGTISVEMVDSLDHYKKEVKDIEDELVTNVTNALGQVIATTDNKFYVTNEGHPTQRIIRASETNLGDLVADSVYWYFNNSLSLDCDIALINGGGIRAEIEPGNISYLTSKSIQSFGNVICAVKTTGRNILNALEMGASDVGGWDDTWNSPTENGGFMQVSGLKYTIDASITSTIQKDAKGEFVEEPTEYKVKDVQVFDKNTSTYVDLDLNKEYTVGGISYFLRNGGNGLNMFNNSQVVLDYVGEDYMIFADYLKSFEKDGEFAKVSTQNSPLNNYNNFLLDYENSFGSGRINIINTTYTL